MAETFLADYARTNGTGVVRFIGELDLAGAEYAKDACISALSALNGDGTPLVIDLSELSFCDSSGLRALFAIRNEAQAAGHAVVLRRPHELLRRLLAISAMSDAFAIET